MVYMYTHHIVYTYVHILCGICTEMCVVLTHLPRFTYAEKGGYIYVHERAFGIKRTHHLCHLLCNCPDSRKTVVQLGAYYSLLGSEHRHGRHTCYEAHNASINMDHENVRMYRTILVLYSAHTQAIKIHTVCRPHTTFYMYISHEHICHIQK